ncbi:protein lethal(3)malignant blood neoplasm 1 [Musca vetustissima]|uniref:protein lethal(3)malignant blood neoplasm 1 n=1 Tax=Musca vetustissima TaxID=27455 RepID=UPI002AB76A9F|nr:protein lethal(3)malignant blood neoplasm 1 [Musca vetustissima]
MTRLIKITASFFIVAVCCSNLLLPQCSAQSTTVRPYKFGFTIDEQQHRRESRDEKGIVMGEFGFITADGIYHVTVYATDEQGRFRILAMKSYPYESPPKTVDITVKPKPTPTTTTTAKPKEDLPHHNFYNEACSGCFLSNGKKDAAKPQGSGETPKTGIRTLSKELPNSTGQSDNVPNSSPGKTNTAGGGKTTTPTTKVTLTQTNIKPHIETFGFNTPTTTKVVTKPSKSPQPLDTKGFKNTNTPKTTATTQTKQTPQSVETKGSKDSFTPKQTAPTTTNLASTQTKKTPQPTQTKGFKDSIIPKTPTATATSSQTKTTEHTTPHSNTPSNSIPLSAKPTQVTKILTPKIPSVVTVLVRKAATIPSTTQIIPLLSGDTNNPNTNTKLAKTPPKEKDIMDFIVNKVLPAAMGTKGVVVKAPNAPSGKSPVRPQTPIGNSPKTPLKSGPTSGSGGGNSVAGSFNPKSPGSAVASGKGSSAGSAVGVDGDLYRFKYILDYHGHTETGKRNGNKEGNYFAIGDDDVERTIEYVADENGYQPRITWRKRNQKDNLPKENNLKEYEFVWFYDK